MIAEGIETAGQLARIRTLGIECAQGYLHGRPVRAEALESRLRTLPAVSSHAGSAPAAAAGTAW